jgi:hypothetical protein
VRKALVLALLGAAACSSGSPIIPANLRGPVAIAPFQGVNPDVPQAGLVPLLAVASFRGDELRIIDPVTAQPVPSRNLAWPLGVPTLPRPQFLSAASLGDGKADLLVVASSEPRIQVLGTWLDGSNGFGVTRTIDLSSYAGAGAQLLSVAIMPVPSGAPTGQPPAAPTVPGKAWVVVGLTNPDDATSGQLAVLEFARNADGSISMPAGAVPHMKPVGFSPTGLAASPDNVHLYASTTDAIRETSGRQVYGVAEITVGATASDPWTYRGLGSRGCGTTFVAAAFVGERSTLNFYTFDPPALRVYGGLDSVCCGPDQAISCGVATYDPSRAPDPVYGNLAADPAFPGPPGWQVPVQTYRTPMFAVSQPIAFGIAPPAMVPAPVAPTLPFGSQVCWSPYDPTSGYPSCPTVTEVASQPEFNGKGAPQRFMLTAPAIGQLWTSVTGLLAAADGLSYVQDLGRYGVVNGVSMLNDDTMRVQAGNANPVGPVGPFAGTPFFGFPEGSAAIGMWRDYSPGGQQPVEVVYQSDDLAKVITVWPGFTRDDNFRVSYQGILPGFSARRSVLGMWTDPGTSTSGLYIAIQEAAVPGESGILPASGYWVTGAIVDRPELGIHTIAKDGAPGDIAQFLIDEDPCPSTRPNWIPSDSTTLTPVYDSTKAPQAHESVLGDLLPRDPLLYPGGALKLLPADDPALAQEYACLLTWFQQPGRSDQVLTMFRNLPPIGDWPRGTWVRAGGFLLAGRVAGYAGRPQLDVSYDFAWTTEEGLGPEALSVARKARRFYYPSAYPSVNYGNYPLMEDPMQPGPVVGFRLGRYCPVGITGCDAKTSFPARDAGVDFFTQSGVVGMSRYISGASVGNSVTSFDQSTIPGQEFRGRVFYETFVGDTIMMFPPGLDTGQVIVIR